MRTTFLLFILLFSLNSHASNLCEASAANLWATQQEHKKGLATKEDLDLAANAYNYCEQNKAKIEANNHKIKCASLSADLWATEQEHKAGLASEEDYNFIKKIYKTACAEKKTELSEIAGCEGGQLSHDSTRISCPNGKVYKIDSSVNTSNRKDILKAVIPQGSSNKTKASSSSAISK